MHGCWQRWDARAMPPDDDDIELLQSLISHGGEQAFKLVPTALAKVIDEKQWQKRFPSFEMFVQAKGLHGLGTSMADLEAFCRKRPDVWRKVTEQVAELQRHGGDRSKQGDNVTLSRGNSALYTLKRLKRDRPDLFQQVLGGGLSANAAAVEAGFRKQPTPIELILKQLARLKPTDWSELDRLLNEHRPKNAA